MKSEKDIEQLFKHAQVPPVRQGLKERILAAAEEGGKRAWFSAPAVARWAIAACLLLALGLNMITGRKERNLLAQLKVPEKRLDVNAQMELFKEYNAVGLLAYTQPAKQTIDFKAIRLEVEKLLEGGPNGS